MTDYTRKALVGDIGATNIRFAVADIDELTIDHFATLSGREYDHPVDALRQYLRAIPGCPDMVGLAVAGNVKGDHARLRSSSHALTLDEVRGVTGASRVHLTSRIEALALAVPHLTAHDLVEVKHGRSALGGTKVVIAPGTGLEVGALVFSGDRWHPVEGQGGLIALNGAVGEERDLLDRLHEGADYLPAERVLSGPGLSKLYRMLAEQGSETPDLTVPQIVRHWHESDDAIALRALQLYSRWLGRFAGDIALNFGATGGVYLGGGIAPHIVPLLAEADFKTAFEGRGPMSEYLAAIPVSVIKTGADAGLRGATIALAQSLPEPRPD